MQHALASILATDTNEHPDTTLATQPDRQQWNPKCRCKQCTGQGLGWITHEKPKNSQASNQGMNDRFTFDSATGEMFERTYTTQPYEPAPYDYPVPTQVGIPLENLAYYELDPAPRPGVTEVEVDVEVLPVGVIDLDAERSRRGPKPKVKANQYASLLKVAHAEKCGWVDDYVFGASAVAGVSNGILNASPSRVLQACLLDEISVETVKSVIRLEGLRTMSDQQARRICQCARVAIGGMELYLERNPTVRQALQFEVDFTYSYYEGNAEIPLRLVRV